VQTNRAKSLAEQANQAAQQDRELAIESKELAQKREGLAFESLLRFQDILLVNQSQFQSEKLTIVQEQFSQQAKATFEGILENISDSAIPQADTLRYLQVFTHRLAAMEKFAGRNEQALDIIDKACGWMHKWNKVPGISDEVRKELDRRIGELRSIQGNIALMAGQIERAKQAIHESITKLFSLVNSEQPIAQVSQEIFQDAVGFLAQSYTALSSIEQLQGDFQQGKLAQGYALNTLAHYKPSNHTEAMVIVQAHYGMAILHTQCQEPEQAVEQFKLAADAIEQAGKFIEDNPPLEFLIYESQLAYHRSNMLLSQNKSADAIKVMQHQMHKDAKALSSHPAISPLLDAYQRDANMLQGLLALNGQYAQAIVVCRSWIELANSLLIANPQNEPVVHFAIMSSHIMGHLNQQMNQADEASGCYHRALTLSEQYDASPFRTPRLVYQRVELLMHLFQATLTTSSHEAEAIFEKSVVAAKLVKELAQAESQELALAIQQLKSGIDAMRKSGNLELANRWEADLKSASLWDHR